MDFSSLKIKVDLIYFTIFILLKNISNVKENQCIKLHFTLIPKRCKTNKSPEQN